MKKTNLLNIFIIVYLIAFVSSCKKDPADSINPTVFSSPIVSFTNGNQEVYSYTIVTIVGSVYAPDNLDKIQYFLNDTSYGTDITSFDTDTTHEFTVTIAAHLVNETFTFEVKASDKNGKIGKKTATISVIAAPTVLFTLGDQEVDPNTVVTIVGSVFAPAELDKIQYFIDEVSYGAEITNFDTDTTHVFTVTIAADLVVETFTFEVQATDKYGKIGNNTATVTVTNTSTGSLVEFTVTLGDQNDSEGSFIDLNTSDIYSINDSEANDDVIDMLYYWGNVGNASFYSPQGAVDNGITFYGNLWDWTTLATTVFKLDNTADYANATYESVETGIGSTRSSSYSNC